MASKNRIIVPPLKNRDKFLKELFTMPPVRFEIYPDKQMAKMWMKDKRRKPIEYTLRDKSFYMQLTMMLIAITSSHTEKPLWFYDAMIQLRELYPLKSTSLIDRLRGY